MVASRVARSLAVQAPRAEVRKLSGERAWKPAFEEDYHSRTVAECTKIVIHVRQVPWDWCAGFLAEWSGTRDWRPLGGVSAGPYDALELTIR